MCCCEGQKKCLSVNLTFGPLMEKWEGFCVFVVFVLRRRSRKSGLRGWCREKWLQNITISSFNYSFDFPFIMPVSKDYTCNLPPKLPAFPRCRQTHSDSLSELHSCTPPDLEKHQERLVLFFFFFEFPCHSYKPPTACVPAGHHTAIWTNVTHHSSPAPPPCRGCRSTDQGQGNVSSIDQVQTASQLLREFHWSSSPGEKKTPGELKDSYHMLEHSVN